MQKYLRKTRPISDYSIFALITFLIVIAFCFFTALYISFSYKTGLNSKVTDDSIRIDRTISEVYDVTNKLLSHIGRQIAEHGSNDLEYIHKLFIQNGSTSSNEGGLFSWSMYDWVDSKNLQLVNSRKGVRQEPPDMSIRDYTKTSPLHPWTLQVSIPAVGNPSGLWVIPAGTGVVDKYGKYLGAIVVGFSVAELTTKIEQALKYSTSFIVIDDKRNIVYQSADSPLKLDSDFFKLNQQFDVLSNSDKGYFSDTISLNGDIELVHFQKMTSYPYTIITGYNNALVSKEVNTLILPRITELGGMGLIALTLLYLFRQRMVKPLEQLSDAALAIAKGNRNVRIPRIKSYEMFILAKVLQKTKSYKRRDKQVKKTLEKANKQLQDQNETLNHYSKNLKDTNQQLEETKSKLEKALQLIHDSEREREEFLGDMHRALNIPISAIKNGTSLIKSERLGVINRENYALIFDALYDASKQLESLTTEFLNPTQIDISEVLKRCVTLQRRYAIEKGVDIKLVVSRKLPEIWGDRLRIRQIILSTIYHSLLYIPDHDGKSISISAKLEGNSEQSEQWLVIEIKDNGFGVDEITRNTFWSKHFNGSDSYNRDPNMMNLDIKSLRHLVQLHYGTFDITVQGKKGTTFTIRIPYLTREELEMPIEMREQYDKKAIEFNNLIQEKLDSSQNIIKFPNKNNQNIEDTNN